MPPLSDREQQILAEMERNLGVEDPALARANVQTQVPERSDTRGIKLGAFIFILGIAALVGFFSSGNLIVGVVAFGAMVGGIVVAGSALRALFTNPEAGTPGRAGRAMADLEEKLRQRYRKP
jgi:hypothetical protein